MAKAVTIDDVLSAKGTIDVTATTGTLALGTASSLLGTTLLKQNGSVSTPGDELRFGSILTGSQAIDGAAAPIRITSSTHVRGNTITAKGGDVTIKAGFDGVTTSQPGEVTGLTGPAAALAITATGENDMLTDPSAGGVFLTSGAFTHLGNIDAGKDISVVSGTQTSPMNGAILIANANSATGSVYLTTKNATPGSPNGIDFASIKAAQDAILITSVGNGGDVTGGTITAGRDIGIGANDIDFVSGTAGRNIAMRAVNSISVSAATALTAGGSIAGQAGTSITLGAVTANGRDVAFKAGGNLRGTTITAADDITLVATDIQVAT